MDPDPQISEQRVESDSGVGRVEPPEPRDSVGREPSGLSFVADVPSAIDMLGHERLVTAVARFMDQRAGGGGPSAIGITGPHGVGKSFFTYRLARLLHEGLVDDGGAAEHRHTWYTVTFDAFRYEQGERLWSALAKAIYDQPWREMHRWKRARFWVLFEWRRRWRPFLVRAIGFFALGTVSAMLTSLAGGSPVATPIVGIAGGVVGLLAVGARQGLEASPFRQAIESYAARSPDSEQRGFTAETEGDINRLVDALTEGSGTLAVLVTNLQRCSGPRIIELLQAIYQLRTTNCFFVLEMDREAVAMKIEMADRETIAYLSSRKHPSADHYGLRFLSNVLDLSIALPPPDDAAMPYIAGLIGPLSSTVTDARPDAEAQVTRLVRMNLDERRRFDQAFQLQLDVAAEAEGNGRSLGLDEMIAFGKWVAVRVHWPGLALAIDLEPDLLKDLEHKANDDRLGEGREAVSPGDSASSGDTWLSDPTLVAVLREGNIARRISSLPRSSLLFVW
jgi:KAP family P-loop domain